MSARTRRRPSLPATPPPGPFRPGFWRSPLRGPQLTSLLGLVLLGMVAIVATTGFLSHAAYMPDLPGNRLIAHALPLTFDWPTSPSWIYAVNQSLHTNVGLVAIPFLLAKLWSVIPKLFAWPPAASPAQAIERLSIALLVSSAVFEFATGVLNMQYWYAFKFNFVVAHYYGAVVFVASLILHVLIKVPAMRGAYATRKQVVTPEREGTMSRRGLFAFAGAASFTLLAANAGQSIGGPLRATAFLAPRRQGGFPVNKTAAAAKVTREMVGANYRLQLNGVELSRTDLLALEQRTRVLPIACVEGWTTTQTWTGVPLALLAELAGVPDPHSVLVRSLQPKGVLSKASLSHDQIANPSSLLALRVNGGDLPMDHGYPARIIVPGLPGVHNVKWVGAMEFGEGSPRGLASLGAIAQGAILPGKGIAT
jgi:DMSO/TMAO reductase YedYZ molybdopterin-dependent catalytic subunit